MKIVHLSAMDINGGAAKAAYRLHQGLLRFGQDSSMFVQYRNGSDSSVIGFSPLNSMRRRINRRFRYEVIRRDFSRYRITRPKICDSFNDDRSCYGPELLSQLPVCDVVNLHWVAGFIDYRSFFGIVPVHTPVVWTLHDMNPFTGGCHYDYDCGKYVESCGSCPQLGSGNKRDLSYQILQRKSKALGAVEQKKLHIVAPSRWLATEARRSSLFRNFSISKINNGIDTALFAPRDRAFARSVLGVPSNALVLLFAAESLEIWRKGISLLVSALSDLKKDIPELFLLSFGYGESRLDGSVRHLHLGYIAGDHLLSIVYSAADIFVIPSLYENLPNTVMESLACGIPIIGFDVGGIPEMVRSKITGMLVPSRDVKSLRSAIIELLKDPARRSEMSLECRRIAIKEFALEQQANRYHHLYESLIESCL